MKWILILALCLMTASCKKATNPGDGLSNDPFDLTKGEKPFSCSFQGCGEWLSKESVVNNVRYRKALSIYTNQVILRQSCRYPNGSVDRIQVTVRARTTSNLLEVFQSGKRQTFGPSNEECSIAINQTKIPYNINASKQLVFTKSDGSVDEWSRYTGEF